MTRFLHIASWRTRLAARLAAEVARACGRRLHLTWKRALDASIVLLLVLSSVALWRAPGPQPVVGTGGLRTARATVVEVDDSGLSLHGVIAFGTQRLTVRLADGRTLPAYNELRAQLELDKRFAVGDQAQVLVPEDETSRPVESVVARDYWRLGGLGALFGAFALLLVLFGGMTGLRALFTFAFGCLAIWKLLVPLVLRGSTCSLASFATVAVLTAAILLLVAGVTRKAFAAFLGSMLGIVTSFGLARLATVALHINGATMPFAQQLLYAGSVPVDLQDIFIGAMVLASSGAVMDLAMDIAAGVEEVRRHSPRLGTRALFLSGVRIGRAVVGTMTTTLLLAYSGGFLTLLMVFAAEGTRPLDFLNSALVSAEVVKTLVGSLGLVLVAPFTALASAVLYRRASRA